MDRINTPPHTGLNPGKYQPRKQSRPEPTTPAPEQDRISVSIDARVKLGKDNRPEVVLEGVEVDGLDVSSQVDANMQGRRAGLRDQITRAVADAVAKQVAEAIVPVLEDKLESALEAEGLPAGLADDLAREAVPEIAGIIARRLAEEAKVSYKWSLF